MMRACPAAIRSGSRRLVQAVAAGVTALITACITIPPIPASTPMPPGSFSGSGGHWTTFPAGHDRGIAELTPARWAELVTVHAVVDLQIVYASDEEAHGAVEHWGLPARGKGDCEDIALEKAARLLGLGWPRNALRMAVVYPAGRPDRKRVSHAVLTVETDHGVYVLDRLQGSVPVPWARTPYDWIAREIPRDGVVRWEFFIKPAPGGTPPPSCG